MEVLRILMAILLIKDRTQSSSLEQERKSGGGVSEREGGYDEYARVGEQRERALAPRYHVLRTSMEEGK